MSPETVRAYEMKSRRPDLARLQRLLNALNPPRAERNAILRGAGFLVEDAQFPSHRFPNYFFSAGELDDAIERYPWPSFVLNDSSEFVAANKACGAIWGVDFHAEREKRTRPQMNVLSVASDLRFADKLVNWEACIGALIAAVKGRPHDPRSMDEPDPYFDQVLAEFAEGDPRFLQRIAEVWEKTTARAPKCRWGYPVVWRDPDVGEMRFDGLVTTASEPDALAWNDWIPLDAQSWSNLESVKRRQP